MLPVTLKLNIGTPEVPVVETKSLDNGATFGAINDLAVLVYDEKGENPIVTFQGHRQTFGDIRTVVAFIEIFVGTRSDCQHTPKEGCQLYYIFM